MLANGYKKVGKILQIKALYIHYLCVDRLFSGLGLSKSMIDFAEQYANDKNIKLLRVDTNAEEMKLRRI